MTESSKLTIVLVLLTFIFVWSSMGISEFDIRMKDLKEMEKGLIQNILDSRTLNKQNEESIINLKKQIEELKIKINETKSNQNPKKIK